MRNPLLDRIDNYKFSIRVARTAQNNGIKTVGKMIIWANQNKNYKNLKILEELNQYVQKYKNRYFDGW